MQKENDPQLEKFLRGLERPVLSDERKMHMKSKILMDIDLPVVSYVKQSENLVLPLYKRIIMKENIMSAIVDAVQERFSWSVFVVFHKKMLSAFLLFLMVFGMFSFVNIDTHVVRASTFTTLDNFEGEIALYRDGVFMNIEKGMRILEDDSLMTGEDSYATVRFFDDSISRLDALTEVFVKKLARPTRSLVKSEVEFKVRDGNVWSRVVNLVDDSSFSVEAGDLLLTTSKAAFNVEVSEDEVEVGVFDNAVELRGRDSAVSQLGSGSKAVSKSEKVEIQELLYEEKNNRWVAGNLDSDEKYLIEVEKRLVVVRMESLGIDNFDDVDFETSLREEAKMWLTFDDVKKGKMQLDLAEKRFVAAQLKLSDPRITPDERIKVRDVINDFEDEVQSFVNLVTEVSTLDDEYAVELEEYVEDKVLSQRKDLNVIDDSSSSFEAKEVLERLSKKLKKDEKVEDVVVEEEIIIADEKVEDVVVEEEVEVVVEEKITTVEAVRVDSVVPVIKIEDRDAQKKAAEEFGVKMDDDKPLDPLLGN